MVEILFDNKHGLTFEQALEVFGNSFENSLVEAVNYGMSFKIMYKLNDYTFLFRSERGYVEEYTIKKDGVRIDLTDYDPMLKNIEAASQKNIIYLINTVKRFIQEQTPI